jgi:hypothetical protein
MAGKELGRITEYGWQIVERLEDDGNARYFLNKVLKGRSAGTIICSKDELRRLKHFMEDRKFN